MSYTCLCSDLPCYSMLVVVLRGRVLHMVWSPGILIFQTDTWSLVMSWITHNAVDYMWRNQGLCFSFMSIWKDPEWCSSALVLHSIRTRLRAASFPRTLGSNRWFNKLHGWHEKKEKEFVMLIIMACFFFHLSFKLPLNICIAGIGIAVSTSCKSVFLGAVLS